MAMTDQLVLGVRLPSSATLDAFVGAANDHVKANVAQIVAGRGQRLFVHGPHATGKTHLLQAACRAVGEAGARSVYLPLAQFVGRAETLLAGLQQVDCVCVDDVDAIAGRRDAEIALLGLTDALRARRGRLLAAARRPADQLGLALPDLASRLAWGGSVASVEPGDVDKRALLVARAAQRGMRLPEACAEWVLRHRARDVPALMAALDALDHASLVAQRRLTLPFVKQVLSGR